MFQSVVHARALTLGEKAVPLLIIAIHYSTSLTLILSIVLLLCWLAAGCYRQLPQLARQLPPVSWTLGLAGVLLASCSYSIAPLDALGYLSKYRELLLLPVLIPFLNRTGLGQRNERWLLAVLLVALVWSYLGHTGLGLFSKATTKILLKNRITHSLFMAFLAFYSGHQLYIVGRYRWFWLVVLLLTIGNLFLVGDGRTGQLAFLCLALLYCLQVFDTRKAGLAIILLFVAFGLFVLLSPTAARIWEGVNNTADFLNHDPKAGNTSMGLRLRFWQNAWAIIQQAPWLGHGSGGFPLAFHALFPQYSVLENPHNEFLLITAQTGVFGLAVFLGLLASVWRQSMRINGQARYMLQGVWVITVVSCLFNSSILDHTEGHWLMLLLALYLAPLAKESGHA